VKKLSRGTVYNSITSDELWNDVNKENKSLLKDFINYCKSIDRSEGTIINYTSDLKIFFTWNLLENNDKTFYKFNKKDLIKYQNYLLNELNLSSNRIRRLRSAVSSMSNYIENIMDDDFPDFKNIVGKISAPTKNEVREKTVLSDDQIDSLLEYLVDKKKYQAACAVALAVGSGARKSELLRFKVSHFVDENIIYGALYKTPEKMKTKGRGKAGKLLHRYVLINKFKPYFDLWMQEREQLGIQGENLFWTKNEGIWTPAKISTLNSWASTFSKILNVDWYWHCNRHYFTTALCKANIPAEVIKEIVGWESVSMVSIYNDTVIDEELGKYFDNNGIKQIEIKTLSDIK
jgi:integrase